MLTSHNINIIFIKIGWLSWAAITKLALLNYGPLAKIK